MEENEEKKDCFLCGKALGIFGLIVSAVFAFVAIDTLTNNGLTSALSRKGKSDDE